MASLGLQPGSLDLVMYAGDDFAVDIQFNDTAGDGVDLSGWSSWSAQIRQSAVDGTVVESLTVGTSSAASGLISLSLAAADVRGLLDAGRTVRRLAWDLAATTDASKARTLLAGSVTVTSDVSRS